METNAKNLVEEFRVRFSEMSLEQVVDAFNLEVGKMGWGNARASYLGALHEALELRGVDYSAIGDAKSLSFRERVALTPEGKRVKPIF